MEYCENRSGAADIRQHFRACDPAFLDGLSRRVDVEAYVHKLAERSVRFEAWDGDVLAGLVAVYLNGTAGPYDYITSVSVAVAYAGQGVAAALLSRALDQAQRGGASDIRLEVAATNGRAISLYKKFEFVEGGAGADDCLVFTRHFDGPPLGICGNKSELS